MSTLAIILIVLAVLVAVVFAGGLFVSRRRQAATAANYQSHVAAADQALEQARASDRGWDRAVLERTARDALERERPDWSYRDLYLVLVDDRPGVAEDRAHFAAIGSAGETRVVLVRGEDGWAVEHLGPED